MTGLDHEMLNDFVKFTIRIIMYMAVVVKYYAATIPIFALASTRQEYKIWKSTPTPLTIFGMVKVFIFNVIWMVLTLIASISLLPMWAQRGFGNGVELEANMVMEKFTAMAIQGGLVGSVEIINEEKIPPMNVLTPESPAPVYIANHCSQIDVSSVYYVLRHFKWIAKESTQLLPGVGNIMKLSGHIFIKRSGKNSKSKSNLYELSNNAIQSGVPMMFFPQGTRTMSKKLPFKDGAFKIAIQNESLIVPISIHVPPNAWNCLYPLNLLWGGADRKTITITVHDPIEVKQDSDKAELKKQCEEIIYSVLPSIYHGEVASDGDNKEKTS